jgi:anti-sigma factor RsiW
MDGLLREPPPDLAPVDLPMTDSHLSVATIASYVDNVLEAEARAEADRHLAACAHCRGELASVADLVVDLPPARRRPGWRVAAGALAAAGIVGILVTRPARSPMASGTTERATRPAAAMLEIVEPPPAGGAPGALRDGRIVWRAVEPRATYRVTVTDTTGATRWSAETPDTAVVLPPSARLEAGARYYLYVDALRADGWSLQSGPREFSTVP